MEGEAEPAELGNPSGIGGFDSRYEYGAAWYSARIHQRLKQAANIHDATTESDYPTVFRPQFRVDGSDIYIAGYVQESNTHIFARPWRSLTDTNDLPNPDDNVYGIPVIVGAKKGWPNFNKFAVRNRWRSSGGSWSL